MNSADSPGPVVRWHRRLGRSNRSCRMGGQGSDPPRCSASAGPRHSARLTLARYLEGRIGGVQLVVIGDRDANRVAQLVGPHGLPILAHADCSVLVVRGKP
jgi:hypothetical protein